VSTLESVVKIAMSRKAAEPARQKPRHIVENVSTDVSRLAASLFAAKNNADFISLTADPWLLRFATM
jgi:hypothetical protein